MHRIVAVVPGCSRVAEIFDRVAVSFDPDRAVFEEKIETDLFVIYGQIGLFRIRALPFYRETVVFDARRIAGFSVLVQYMDVFPVLEQRIAARQGEFYGCRLAATRQNRGCGDD